MYGTIQADGAILQGYEYAERNLRRERRRQEMIKRAQTVHRQYMMILGAIALLVIVVSFVVSGITPHAASEDAMDTIYYKYYTNVMIGPNETMDDIVEQYADEVHYRNKKAYLSEVAQINHLEMVGDYVIGVGNGTHVVVPYYSTEYK